MQRLFTDITISNIYIYLNSYYNWIYLKLIKKKQAELVNDYANHIYIYMI